MLSTGDCIGWDIAGVPNAEDGVLEVVPIGLQDKLEGEVSGGGMPCGDGDVDGFCARNVVEVAGGLCTCGL